MCKKEVEEEIKKKINILTKLIRTNKKEKAKEQRKELDKLLKEYFNKS